MRITTNYAYPVLTNRYNSVQKRNNNISNNLSFEGSEKPKKSGGLKWLIIPVAAGALGLTSCNSRSPEDRMTDAYVQFEQARMDEIERNARDLPYYDDDRTRFETIDYEAMKDTTDYNPVIDKFMAEDKSIVRVEKSEWDDAKYVNSYRIIGAEGFDKNGRRVRMIAIHAEEPSRSCVHPTYGDSGIEKTYYYPDKTVTEYCTNDEEQKIERIETEYKGKNFKLDGKGGYSKKVIEYPEPREYDGVIKQVVMVRGEEYECDGVPVTDDKSYHKRETGYGEDGKIVYQISSRPNEYGEIVSEEDANRD